MSCLEHLRPRGGIEIESRFKRRRSVNIDAADMSFGGQCGFGNIRVALREHQRNGACAGADIEYVPVIGGNVRRRSEQDSIGIDLHRRGLIEHIEALEMEYAHLER